MGVDTRIFFPAAVAIRDVAQFIGRLLGLPVIDKPYSMGPGTYKVVAGVSVIPLKRRTLSPDMVEITWRAPKGKPALVHGERVEWCFYHFETSGKEAGMKSIGAVRSTAVWCAIGKRCVQFFGGFVDYQDCDARSRDFSRPARRGLGSENERVDARLQRAILETQPLTRAELREGARKSAYGMPDPCPDVSEG